MSDIAIDKDLLLNVNYAKAVPGDTVKDACMQEFADRLQISVRSESVLAPEVKISPDSDNILTKNSVGELRVQKDTFYSETQDVPIPPPIEEGGGSYTVPITRFRIKSIILVNGDVVEVPNEGVDGGYPADLAALVTNLNAEAIDFSWGSDDGLLTVESDLGLQIEALIEGGEDVSDPIKKIGATEIEGGVPGNSVITFEEAHVNSNIDYASQFAVWLDITPGDGFDKAYITSKTSSVVTVKIEGVSKVLEATLKVFTPAQKEDSSEF
jgi:hypothetical protein